MKTNENNLIITIDAAGETLGRVASRAAAHLRGKNSPAFERHQLPRAKVKIVNAAKVKITGRKLTDKLYHRYSGYPGGLRAESLEQLLARRGAAEVFRLAIKRMLPANKLRDPILKNLTVEN
ncbi:MAG: 50S ribosomal protein L13 [Patescibacteria group bacterium]